MDRVRDRKPSGRALAVIFLFGLLGAATTAACGDDEGTGGGTGKAKETAGQKLCKVAAEAASQCGEGSCDAALAADCTEVVTVLSDPLIGGAKDCIEGGGEVLSCFVSATDGLVVGAAQQSFADAFCADCAFNAPGCDQIANVTTAFGDDVLDEIASTCFTGLTCVASLPSCVQGVLVARAIPDATAQCLVKSFFDTSSSGGSGCGAGGSGP
jgi:hypothetical protein